MGSRAFCNPDSTLRVRLANGDSGMFVSDVDIAMLNLLIVSHDWQKVAVKECYQENNLLLEKVSTYKTLVSKMSGDSTIYVGIIKTLEEKNAVCEDELQTARDERDKEQKKNERLKGWTWGVSAFAAAMTIITVVLTAVK